eukprot:Opistho-2@80775
MSYQRLVDDDGLSSAAASSPARPAPAPQSSTAGRLPADFLSLDSVPQQQQQQQQHGMQVQQGPPQMMGMVPREGLLDVTVQRAELVKNYGLTKMDPYVEMWMSRSHVASRTMTIPNGGTHPVWNQTLHLAVYPTDTTRHVRIIDECI